MPITEIYRAKIDPANVERLLEIRDAAVAEFQEAVPELLRAELVRLNEEERLDIIVWSELLDEEHIARASQRTPTAAEMHGLITDVIQHETGELAHTTHGTWPVAR